MNNYLNINPEGTLLDETQDILEELMMMSRIFTQQIQVVENFKNALEKFAHQQKEAEKHESQDPKSCQIVSLSSSLRFRIPETTLVLAADVLEQMEARKREIGDLSVAAELLSKQVSYRFPIDNCDSVLLIGRSDTAPRASRHEAATSWYNGGSIECRASNRERKTRPSSYALHHRNHFLSPTKLLRQRLQHECG